MHFRIKNYFSWFKLGIFGVLAVASFAAVVLMVVNILFGGFASAIGGEVGSLLITFVLVVSLAYTTLMSLLELVICTLVRRLNAALDRSFRYYEGRLDRRFGDITVIIWPNDEKDGYFIDLQVGNASKVYGLHSRNVANINEGHFISLWEVRNLLLLAHYLEGLVDFMRIDPRQPVSATKNVEIVKGGVKYVGSELDS